MWEIIEEDVPGKFALPMDSLKVQIAATYKQKNKCTKLLEQRRRMLILGRIGTPKIGMMVKQILQSGYYGEEFKREFALYVYYQKYE